MKTAKARDFRKIPVRLICWVDGKPRKIALIPGLPVYMYAFSYTDEGWRSESMLLTLYGRTLHKVVLTDSRDCDGRHGYTDNLICPVAKRAAFKPIPWPGEKRTRNRYPVWNSTGSEVYDQFAQAAGY